MGLLSHVSIIEPSSSDLQTLLAACISPPCYEGICPNDLVRIASASDDYPGRQGQVIVVQPDGCVLVQLYPEELQSTPCGGIQPKEVDDKVTFNPLMITVVLRVFQHDFFQILLPDEVTGHMHDHGEVRRVLDNGCVEMKLSNGISVAPLFIIFRFVSHSNSQALFKLPLNELRLINPGYLRQQHPAVSKLVQVLANNGPWRGMCGMVCSHNPIWNMFQVSLSAGDIQFPMTDLWYQ